MRNHPKEELTFTRVPIQVRATSTMTFAASVPCGERSWAGMLNTPDLEIQVNKALKHVDECERCQGDTPRDGGLPRTEVL